MDPSSSSQRAKMLVVDPYKKLSKQGKYESADTPSLKKLKTVHECVKNTFEYVTTPSLTKMNIIPDSVVTNSSTVDKKGVWCSLKEGKKSPQQRTIMDSTNWKLEFDNKTPIQTKTSPGAVSTETATKSPYKSCHLVGKANQQTSKSTTKLSNQQSKETKL